MAIGALVNLRIRWYKGTRWDWGTGVSLSINQKRVEKHTTQEEGSLGREGWHRSLK